MPGLVRKLLICATAQGLILQPISSRNQPSGSPTLCISYGDGTISPSLKHHDVATSNAEGLESHGLIGILKMSSGAYAISISHRKQVAQIKGRPVYVITGVSFVPLSSQSEAQDRIDDARRISKAGRPDTEADTDTDTDYGTDDHASDAGSEHDHNTLPPTPLDAPQNNDPPLSSGLQARNTTVAEDVIKSRGNYGRFAERWFSKAGWTASGRAKLGMSSSEDDLAREQRKQGLGALDWVGVVSAEEDTVPPVTEDGAVTTKAADPEKTQPESIVKSLTPRILHSLRVLLSSESFYFSYDHDISRRLSDQGPESSSLPLYKRFDPPFFWNAHLAQPIIESGQQAFVLPVMQGFIGQRAFTVARTPKDEADKIVDSTEDTAEVIEMVDRAQVNPESEDTNLSTEKGPSGEEADSRDLLLTLISRRSVKRVGLRYLRRGVDDQGNVANCVETEQILSDRSWTDSSTTFSLTQIRGSIPLFFSQSPYSFKPTPITYGSERTNHTAFNQHFRNLISRYGNIHIASLVDKHATEKAIGELYEHHVDMTNEGEQPSFGFPDSDELTNASKPRPSRQLAFTWFDFHHECRGFNFQNVAYLLDCLESSLTKFGWTEQLSSQTTRHQSGAIRTNCMDCLDRTNVVQSAIAGSILQSQLATLGFTIDLALDPKTRWFNTLWADNGDAISRQYAGTAALKGDYTRTRKRHWTGALSDLSLTLGRYYQNIFSDNFLQTTIDYVLGLGGDGDALWADFETDMVTSDHALDTGRARQAAIERCVGVVLGNVRGEGGEDLVCGWTLLAPADRAQAAGQMEPVVLLLTDAALYGVRFDWATEKVGAVDRVALADVRALQRGVYISSALGARHLDPSRNRGFRVKFVGEQRRVNTRSLDVAEDAQREEPQGRNMVFKALAARQGEESEEALVTSVTDEVQRALRRVRPDAPEVSEAEIVGVDEARRATGYLESLGYSLRKMVWA